MKEDNYFWALITEISCW